MGNTDEKLTAEHTLLSNSEMPIIVPLFKSLSKNTDCIKEDDLMKYWDSQIDPNTKLAEFIGNFLYGPPWARKPSIELQKFAELYVYAVRGSIDELVKLLFFSLGYHNNDSNEIALPLLKAYVEAVVGNFMCVIKNVNDVQYKSWEDNGVSVCQESVQQLAEELSNDVVQMNTQKIERSEVEHWLENHPTFIKMLKIVFTHLYNFQIGDNHEQKSSEPQLQIDSGNELLPLCENNQHQKDFPALIDIAQVVFINSNLPAESQNKWRFLFSSQIHGESFSALLRKISNEGPTVLIVEDTNGYVFGGFATDSWTLSPNFEGNENACLFTLKPKMRCFSTTGYNGHYQYLNLHQQTMPNGLGMGGQHGFWGLWLDSEFGLGESSESCTTFKNYTQLSAGKNFKIRNVEVWGVGPEPTLDEDDEDTPKARSVLDTNIEEKALLKMSGSQPHSEGFREDLSGTNQPQPGKLQIN